MLKGLKWDSFMNVAYASALDSTESQKVIMLGMVSNKMLGEE